MTQYSFQIIVVGVVLFCVSAAVRADDLYVYPGQGQSDEQLAADRYACHRWAVTESDFDPSQYDGEPESRIVRVPIPNNNKAGATGKGAIAGAVAGGIIGSHDGDAGQGAVIGAIVGSIAGAAIEDQGQREVDAQARAGLERQREELERTKAERALRRNNYRRALSACLEGRGYTVR